jgi:hypothetical protein
VARFVLDQNRHPLPLLIGQAWQAWLIFRRNPVRFALWTVLPLNYFLVQNQFVSPQVLYLIGLVSGCLLWGVRRRPWLWLIASAVGLALQQFILEFAFRSHRPWTMEMLNWISGHAGQFVARRAHSALVFGVPWLHEVLCVTALAWLMPPVRYASEAFDKHPTS